MKKYETIYGDKPIKVSLGKANIFPVRNQMAKLFTT